jgi:hypothetical protein
LSTVAAPSCTQRSTISSITAVRTTIGQLIDAPRGSALTIASPRSPPRRRA